MDDAALNDLYLSRLKTTLKHIEHVQKNAMIMAEKLIAANRRELARQLIVNCLQHDISKLSGIEWDYLLTDNNEDKLRLAITQHNRTNFHHPEYWNGIDNMPEVFLAEMVIDWKSRSEELGTDFMKWVKEDAPKRYGYTLGGKTYKTIKNFAELLLGEGFKKLKQ